MKRTNSIIVTSLIIGIVIALLLMTLNNTGYLNELFSISPSDYGDSPYDDYLCFVYKIEPRDGEGVGGYPNKLTAYIYTNAPLDRTNIQFEFEDDSNMYLSGRIWLDGYSEWGSVEQLSQYEFKVSYPITSGHQYEYKSSYKWKLHVWLQDTPHGTGGVGIWNINTYWYWYKDTRSPPNYKPTADAGGPYISQVGKTFTINAGDSSTPTGSNIIDWYWDLNNDGTWDKYGKRTTVSFQNTGIYTIKLLVVNDKAFYDDDTTTVTITTVNNPPVANAGGQYSGMIGENIQLDGSASYDPDDNPLSYEWDVDDDGTYDLTGSIVNVTYYEAGTFNVVLKVSDGQYSDTDTATVTISSPSPPPTNDPPVADADGPYECYVNTGVLLDASGSYDPDGSIDSYKWDIDNDGVWDVFGESVNVTFHTVGTFTVKLNVTDDDGASAEDTTVVTVRESPSPPTPTPPEDTSRSSNYWLFGILALLLLIPVGFIAWRDKNGKKKY